MSRELARYLPAPLDGVPPADTDGVEIPLDPEEFETGGAGGGCEGLKAVARLCLVGVPLLDDPRFSGEAAVYGGGGG